MAIVRNLLSQRTYAQGFMQGFFLASVGVTIGFTLGVLTLFQLVSFRGQHSHTIDDVTNPSKQRSSRREQHQNQEITTNSSSVQITPTERQRLRGKLVVVTGGGAGIGRAICELFASEGADVVVVDLNLERAQETVAALVQSNISDSSPSSSSSSSNSRNPFFVAIKADVSNESQVEEQILQTIVKHFGSSTGSKPVVHVLVNNAAISIGDDVLDPELNPDAWDLNLKVVLKSQYLCSRALLPYMMNEVDGGDGETSSIINITSVNGMTALGGSAYSAAKAGVINLTKNMAIKYGSKGVRVNCISPGTIGDTRIFDSRLDTIADRIAKAGGRDRSIAAIREEAADEFFGRLASWYPMGRVGKSMDIAKAALFLALHSESSWITGTNLVVDGGLTAGLFRMAKELEQS